MTAKPNADVVVIEGNPESPEKDAATAAAMPPVQAAFTMGKYTWGGVRAEPGPLVAEVSKQARRVIQGDMSRIEGMLVAQMHTLDSMFNSLARRAMETENADHVKMWLTASLKAQRQCINAAEALATLKNPAVFVGKQQINQSAGPMQVNNGTPSRDPVKSDRDNELKEITHEHIERLDTRAPGKAGRDDPAMATVGTEHRASHRSRKSQERG
ncbi:hypothetical protein B1757_03855 [Acidithiobacillus marinus]|uniref:Uncharacterized protein n=1 Tax=Acidithiobacillus marinus TaxID=187490 RepID=A0A2I1DNW4_9PROT|nr:hypothetical protein [Acidithiobacillus marinus]PKY11549.1 hypothetical protein B1757_03855 [Acidithiobacillus marinus]